MKKKNGFKKAAVKLNLEKIEIDELSNKMLDGIQGGYYTEPGNYTCNNPQCAMHTLESKGACEYTVGCCTIAVC